MSNAAKLKKKAAEFEQKKQLDKALALYRQILDEADPDDPDVDVGLFNRVGDLLLRQGSVSDAVNYYEKAVDLYAEGGFFNNAIALCNKILRQSPGRNSIYYKLGKISAKKGFKSDAKANFLEYADRMQKAGQLDEAFRALKEFADLCPDQDDIRLMLAEQLAKRERKTEAMEQLQTLYERFEEEGRTSEARATLDRMKAIDPNAEPPKAAEGSKKSQKSTDLVFLDVDYDTTPARRPAPRPTVKLPTPLGEDAVRPSMKDSPVSGLPLIEPLPDPVSDFAPPAAADVPMDPAAFGAMRLGTPMDVPAIIDERHDLALPGELPMLEVDGTPPDGLDLVVPDEDATEPPASLDGLVPPIGRSSGGTAPTLQTIGLEIDHATLPAGADASSLVAPMDLGVEPTTLGGDIMPPSVAPLAGFEGTGFDEAMDVGADLPMLEVPDEAHDGLAFIEEVPGAAHIDVDIPLPDAGDRSTRKLTPAEIAALDAAARRAAHPSAPPGPPAIAAEALELADDLDEMAPVVTGRPKPSPGLVASDDEDGLTLLEVPDEDPDALTLAPDGEDEAEDDEAGSPVADLPLLDADDVPDAIEAPAYDAPAAMDEGDVTPARRGSLDAGAMELADDLPVAAAATNAAGRAARLAQRVEAEPEHWSLRREWAEALLEANDRAGGLAQLDAAMVGAERAGDLELARGIADETIRVDRDSVRHHQKRVEYAFRMADRPRLIDAYLELADALFRLGQPDKAQVVYQRVLELAPDDLRASAALTAIRGIVPGAAAPAASPAPRASTTGTGRRYTGEVSRVMTPAETIVPVAPAPRKKEAPPAPEPRVAAAADDDFVNLGDLLRSTEPEKNTRMVVAEQEPTGDEQADFADMLRKFKQGVSQNVDEEDYDSHYDLGVAYKEMGLLDEAIGEFQKALRGPSRRVRTYEALGQCFLEKKQFQVASTILQRAVAEPGQGDEQLVGVLYLLGYAMEALQKPQDALMYYQRVFAVDIQFRDVVDRLNAVEKVAR